MLESLLPLAVRFAHALAVRLILNEFLDRVTNLFIEVFPQFIQNTIKCAIQDVYTILAMLTGYRLVLHCRVQIQD